MDRKSIRPDFLVVGRILGPWGRRGEVIVQIDTDFPDRFSPGNMVYLNGKPVEIENSRSQKQHLIVKFFSINSIDEATSVKACDLTIPISEIKSLPPDEYYIFQLIGLDVIASDGMRIGNIIDIMTTASNDVYIVETEKGELLIPAIDDVVKSIDIKDRKIIIVKIDIK